MIPINTITQGVQGLTSLVGGAVGQRGRKQEQASAQQAYDMRRREYEALDVSNPYANMQNTMEDLTVNTQAADFAAQQQQQALANTMGSLQGAAGGSGIAAMAQAMANQQSQNLQRASASIAQQESSNRMAERQQAANIQAMEREGDIYARSLQKDKTETLLGMEQQRLGAAKEAVQAGQQQMLSGFGTMAGAGATFMSGFAETAEIPTDEV
jgi:hypothetical protein